VLAHVQRFRPGWFRIMHRRLGIDSAIFLFSLNKIVRVSSLIVSLQSMTTTLPLVFY
jgi:hypothetical protein